MLFNFFPWYELRNRMRTENIKNRSFLFALELVLNDPLDIKSINSYYKFSLSESGKTPGGPPLLCVTAPEPTTLSAWVGLGALTSVI